MIKPLIQAINELNIHRDNAQESHDEELEIGLGGENYWNGYLDGINFALSELADVTEL